ncbi:RRM3 ATP-dependent DNA helicase RRM3 [Candida maltosa Xu316]|uniref:ATP-dependent DNA helicase PIF1 n=1 Tax=Candida maltosa (strain Xu316) TaxID=1245528 RepID=M3JT10_CANMX|nr:ATP-dependent helicase, putative (Dna repair and recombination protein, mitochondrial, putative) [Candida maltosa Xu316]
MDEFQHIIDNVFSVIEEEGEEEDVYDLFNRVTNGYGKRKAEDELDNPAKRPDTKIELSEEQQRVVDLIINEKKSILFTGSAGTGKSVVLRAIVEKCEEIYRGDFGITASTGLAALNIGGQTLHRFLGIRLAKGSVATLAKMINKNTLLAQRWKSLRLLIIDEISMIDRTLFDKLEEVARVIRGNTKPFGGIQIVASGDFFQLPPVSKDVRPTFCFLAESWSRVIKETVVLKQVFRQRSDLEFIRMLNQIRVDECDNDTLTSLKALQRNVTYFDGIEPTQLYPTLKEVQAANKEKLDSLPGQLYEFKSYDTGDKQLLDGHFLAERVLLLKNGVQVMCIKNQSTQLVNGSLGTVLFLTTHNLFSNFRKFYGRLKFDNKDVLENIRFVCKFIGRYEDFNEKDQIFIRDIDREEERKFVEKCCRYARNEKHSDIFPVVKFTFRGDERGLIHLVDRETFQIEERDRLIASRKQLPLILSWAMTIHKSQGQTLDRVKVDLKRIFENGQMYVALSRATTRERLEVKNFASAKIKAAPIVKHYYEQVEAKVDKIVLNV